MFFSTSSDQIVIAVVVRDRFSPFKTCLEAIYSHTKCSFRVVVVVGAADEHTKSYLNQFSKNKVNFSVIFIDRLLMQGEARQISLHQFDERFCVIIENDTIVHENWLSPLLDCMTSENAAVVMPLIYWHRGVHSTGGKFIEFEKYGKVMFKNKILYDDISRKQIDYPENHCLLIDRQQFPEKNIFEDVEPFDVDLGLVAKKNGLRIFFEPQSVVTYEAPPSWEVRDIPPFKFRWNPASWKERNDLFMKKWGLEYDSAPKIASYQRQQIKLGLAYWTPTKLTLGLSNIGVRIANKIHELAIKFKV